LIKMLEVGLLMIKLEFDVPWTVPPMCTEEATFNTLPLATTWNLKNTNSQITLLFAF
jgi:hypothetical protein